jgi:hypothetical protein
MASDRPVDRLFPEEKKLKDKGLCPMCKQTIGPFRDALSKREFHISGLCQKCQDQVFSLCDED